MSREDPFVAVKVEVNDALATAENLHGSWLRILRSTNDPNSSEELRNATTELSGCLSGIEADLDDLDDTIKAVELNPKRFHVTANELQSRREFVLRTRRTVKAMRESIINTRTKAERDQLFTSNAPPRPMAGSVTVDIPEGTDHVERERMQQMMIMDQQDGHLDRMMGTVTNLREVAHTMGQELDDHNVMLDEMDGDVDRTQLRVGSATKRVKDLLLSDSGGSCRMCSLILFLAFILLIVILI